MRLVSGTAPTACSRRACPRRTILQARCYTTSTWDSPIATSDEVTHLKSKFQAYASQIPRPTSSQEQINLSGWMRTETMPQLLAHLHNTEPRTRRASHAMYAWRLRPSASGNSLLLGSSNGGEAGAGERLERLLELGHCENVALVVFRWYGGVKLGSDRWRCISAVAKEALERGGYLGPREDTVVRNNDPGRKRRK
ncbi:ribosomal protein S5 domain 2-like protein [Lentinus tigrinus ALCF2SS1-6]|uniref:Ribosomal protein S5 domain 2-like protein n=2 Tax=Lentinus tigrinus TaxID=5365 RepID=A0A5C2RWY2_9APHY|nr:ribosomal protein S5 domain 2-like protein [Lentinus tigrinus ALCF2SS1-6]